MKLTTNYLLKKPDLTDIVNIDDFNTNVDKIDEELKKVNDSLNKNVSNLTTQLEQNTKNTNNKCDIKNFPRLSSENDDTNRFQRLLDYTSKNNKIAQISENLTVKNTIYLDGNNLGKYTIVGNSRDTIINFQPETDIPLFAIRDSKVESNTEEIIYNNEQTIKNFYIKDLWFKCLNSNIGYFSKFIVYSCCFFDNVYFSHFNRLFVGGAFIYLSNIRRCKIEYIHTMVFDNVRCIDSYFINNYFTGCKQVEHTSTGTYCYFATLFGNVSKISGCEFNSNWIEMYRVAFDRLLGGTRIINNLFDFVPRIIEKSAGPVKFSGNVCSDYSFTDIEKYLNPSSNNWTIRDDLKNMKYYLIYLLGGLSITNNDFIGTSPVSPVYYIMDEYGKNILSDLLLESNNYTDYKRDYKKIFYQQIENNPKVFINNHNSQINDVFFIDNLSSYTRNTSIEGIKFLYNGIDFISRRINTTSIDLSYLGKDFVTKTSMTYYVDYSTGDNTNSGFYPSEPLKTITEVFKRIPNQIDSIYYVYIKNGSYSETIDISGFNGAGTIDINSTDKTNKYNINRLDITNCTANIKINNCDCGAINVLNSNNVVIDKSKCTTTEQKCIYVYNSTVTISNTEFKCTTSNGILATYFAKVFANNNSGTCLYNLISENCSTIYTSGSQATGTNITRTNGTILS